MRNPLEKKILFLKVKNQDKEAYSQFYDLYINRIYRFVFFKVNNVHDAQDLTAETFLKLWQYIKEGKEIDNLNAFIYIVARNAVIDFYREKKKRQTESLEESDASELIDEGKNLLEEQIIGSDLKEVLAGLESLKDEYREVIALRFLDELSISEIAEVLNKSKGAVRVLLHRALQALKDNVHA